MNVVFIGRGVMGLAMAGHLGHEVTVRIRTRAIADGRLAKHGERRSIAAPR